MRNVNVRIAKSESRIYLKRNPAVAGESCSYGSVGEREGNDPLYPKIVDFLNRMLNYRYNYSLLMC